MDLHYEGPLFLRHICCLALLFMPLVLLNTLFHYELNRLEGLHQRGD
jgi:hypothetical protein